MMEVFPGISVQTRAAPAGASSLSPTERTDAGDPGPERHMAQGQPQALLSLPGTQALQLDRPGLGSQL